MTKVKVVCAWCGRHMRGPKNAELVSHGLCKKCEKMLDKMEKEQK